VVTEQIAEYIVKMLAYAGLAEDDDPYLEKHVDELLE
jgi:hypothetical protein